MNDQPTDEDIRRILDEDDIERLVKGILVTLREMTDSEHREYFTLAEVYDKMSLYAYHKRVMDLVCKDHLIPHGLVDSHNNQIKITSKGRHRVDQIKNADNVLWRETLERLGKLSQLKAFTQPMGSLNPAKELWMESDTDMGKISSILAED